MVGDEMMNQTSDLLMLEIIRGYWGYKNQLKTTADALKTVLQWRKENDINNLLERDVPHEKEVMEAWPSKIYGQDMQGHVLNCERIAEIDTAKLTALPLEDVLISRAKAAEMIELIKTEITGDLGHLRFKQTFILDLQGLSVTKHFSSKARDVLKPVFAQGANMYPECLWTLYLINSPFVFRTVWSVIKLWLDPMTVKKIVIVGGKSQYLPMLQNAGIELSQLPEWCGGTHNGAELYDLCQDHQRRVQLIRLNGGGGAAGAGAGASAGAVIPGRIDVGATSAEPIATSAETLDSSKLQAALQSAALDRDVKDLLAAHCERPLASAKAQEDGAASSAAGSGSEASESVRSPASSAPFSAGGLEHSLEHISGKEQVGNAGDAHHFDVEVDEEEAPKPSHCCVVS
jgi:hypothetical protein